MPGPRGYLRQEPCRGHMGILDKEPRCCLVLLFLSRPRRPFVFTKICMPPWRRLSSLGSNVVDGVGTLRLKGVSLVVVLSSGSHLGLIGSVSSQRSACHHAGASRALVPMLSMVSELLGSRVAALLVLGKLPRQGSCRGYAGRPGKGVAGRDPSRPLFFMPLA